MAEDWADDVRKYVPDADEGVIAGIVRYCGIALRSRDASLVSFSDPVEAARVRDNFCRKKLGLTESDADVDAAIARVGERMGGDPTRNRVTVYYLLAEAFGKLGLFGGPAVAEPVDAPVPPAAVPVAAGPPPSVVPEVAAVPSQPGGVVTAAPETFAARPVAAPAPARPVPPVARRDAGMGGTILATVGGLAAIIVGTAAISTVFGTRPAPVAVASAAPAPAPAAPAPVVPEPVAAAPAVAAPEPAVPQGSGVTATVAEGKPAVSVYFDTAKTEVSPDFATVAAPVKAWIDGHPGARLAVSGFNDPRGNAAFNAELSKNRAKKVRAALTALGVPAADIDLVKPADTTDTGTSAAQARRVDITVRDAS